MGGALRQAGVCVPELHCHSSFPQHSLTLSYGAPRRCLCLVLKIAPLFPIFGPHQEKVLGIFILGWWVGWGNGTAGSWAESAPSQAELPRSTAGRPLRVACRSESSFPDKLGVSAAETWFFYATNTLLPRDSDCTTNGTCPVPTVPSREHAQAVPQALSRDLESFAVLCLVEQFPTRSVRSGKPAPPAPRLGTGRGASNLFQ